MAKRKPKAPAPPSVSHEREWGDSLQRLMRVNGYLPRLDGSTLLQIDESIDAIRKARQPLKRADLWRDFGLVALRLSAKMDDLRYDLTALDEDELLNAVERSIVNLRREREDRRSKG